MCLDDRGVRDLLPDLSRRVVTYGRHADADYRVENYRAEGLSCRFDLVRPGDDEAAVIDCQNARCITR